jgi:EpsI family protein
MALRSLIAVLILAVAGAYARDLGSHRAAARTVPDLTAVPREIEGWVGEDYRMSDSVAGVLGADAYVLRRYRGPGGASVWFFLAYFKQQQVGSQIHSPRNCLPGSGWTVLSLRHTRVDLGGRAQPVERMMIERHDEKEEMLYWFRTRSGTVTGEYALKWDLVRNSLLGRPTDAAFLRFNAPVADAGAMRAFMTAVKGPVDRVLGEAGLR